LSSADFDIAYWQAYAEQVEIQRNIEIELWKSRAIKRREKIKRLNKILSNHPSGQVRGCDRKVRYKTKVQAQLNAEVNSTKWYDCAYCNGWHLTSKNE